MYPHSVMWIHNSGVVVLAGERYVPWQQLVDLANGVVGDAFEDVVEIEFWVEPVELG